MSRVRGCKRQNVKVTVKLSNQYLPFVLAYNGFDQELFHNKSSFMFWVFSMNLIHSALVKSLLTSAKSDPSAISQSFCCNCSTEFTVLFLNWLMKIAGLIFSQAFSFRGLKDPNLANILSRE